MKLLKWLSDNIMLIFTLFLLAFIPLYPKLPVIGIQHTWVYIRAEDFLVAVAWVIFFVQLLRKKATFKTPLTVPILLFWGVGIFSTIFSIIVYFPHMANVFPSVAIFHALRRVEYLSLFFLAYSAVKNKNVISPTVVVTIITVLGVVVYGIGQRFLGFPAYLTMNEEFAKGIPLTLSALARIPSTFAGHYDLAAYLVMMIAFLGSMIFGYRKWYVKVILFFTAFAGLILLLMTASRTSFLVYLVTVIFMLFLQKQKKLIIPVIILSLIVLQSFQGISQRFGSTISEANIVYDARTGKAVGVATEQNGKVVIEETTQTGESLPQGTGYLNLPGGDAQASTTQIVYKRSVVKAGTSSAEVTNIQGNFIIKKAFAYDVSFTTRFQGEWPRAIEAFQRNLLFGSGYSSINLATDGNYLRILGEVGLLGFIAFGSIFLFIFLYAYHLTKNLADKKERTFVIGILSAIFGLALNAVLIDVFEASKVAFVLWMLVGLLMGVLIKCQTKVLNIKKELRFVLTSIPALVIYIFVITFGVYLMMVNNYFVGDDFTWLKWVADCKASDNICPEATKTLSGYFTSAEGFFYRPGTKLYFYLMYAISWLSPVAYHVMSIFFHGLAGVLVLLLSKKLLKSNLFAFITSLMFVLVSANFEAVFWISSIGHLLTGVCILLSIYMFMLWKEKKNLFLFIFSLFFALCAPLFHEYGIVAPILVVAYGVISSLFQKKQSLKEKLSGVPLLLTIPVYLLLRSSAQSLWSTGDYSYNLAKLPFNTIGNIFGYIGFILIGNPFLPYYEMVRSTLKTNLLVASIVGVLGVSLLVFLWYLIRKFAKSQIPTIVYALIFFIIPLLAFLGLGNIAPRYSYLASFGIVLLVVLGIQHVYQLVERVNKHAASFLLVLFVMFYSLYHVTELQMLNKDWHKAGEITRLTMINLNDTFSQPGATVQNPVFYFSQVPIRYNSAWVFPVGLPEALWFTFQNENLTVHQVNDITLSVDEQEASLSARFFQFNKDGTIEQIQKTEEIVPTVK